MNKPKEGDTRKDPCKKQACRIQSCLKNNNWQENACLTELEDMRQCCLVWYKTSVCCSGIKLANNFQTGEPDKNFKKD